MKRKQVIWMMAGATCLLSLATLWYFCHVTVMMRSLHRGVFACLTEGLSHLINHPFEARLTGQALRYWVFFLGMTISVALLFYSSSKMKTHYKTKEALGRASWLSGKALDDYIRKYSEPFGSLSKDGKNNMILADALFQSLDEKATNRNANVLLIGGSGRGKTYRFVGPNILQANCSFITTDPSGSIYRAYGSFFEREGYRVRCFNLSHMEASDHYNPFHYIESDKDIFILVDMLIDNTTPQGARSSEPFWEKAEAAFFSATIALIWHYFPEPLKNFSTVASLIRMGDVPEEGGGTGNPLDALFSTYKEYDPEGLAFKQYESFKIGAGKTLKSILISCAFRIRAFDLEDVRRLTSDDDMELDHMGDEKTALFIIIPTGERTFNFLASMMYSQLFIRLYDYCENTAAYSCVVKDAEGEIIRTFRAGSEEEKKEVLRFAKGFASRAEKGHIEYDRRFSWYVIRTDAGEFVTYRTEKEEAEKALSNLKGAAVASNGESLPIHTRMMLDEFANIGSIPDFETKVSTIRKYKISVTIILQALQQLKLGYEKSWETLSSNCDNICYLGGGADADTTEWMAKLIGKETRLIAGNSYSGRGGSLSINAQGVDLADPASLRTLGQQEMVVLPVGTQPYRGKMYDTPRHKNWKYIKDAPVYRHDGRKAAFFRDEESKIRAGYDHKETPLSVVEEDERSAALFAMVKGRKSAAAQFAGGEDFLGNIFISVPAAVKGDGVIKRCLEIRDEETLEKAGETLVALNDGLEKVYTVFREVRADGERSDEKPQGAPPAPFHIHSIEK